VTPIFEVIRAGTMATIQDLGRPGHQRFGMPVSGAMDAFSLRAANLLVGNEFSLAAIEIALGGLELRTESDCVAAICGAALGVKLDGQPCPLWKSLLIRRGQRLAWSGGGPGVWSYLAVAGGLEGEAILGSKSTYLRGAYGGIAGRAVRTGDVLHAGASLEPPAAPAGRTLSGEWIPCYTDLSAIRVIIGPDADMFTPEAIHLLLTAEFQVSNRSDRMGYRLHGPGLAHRGLAEIFSGAVTAGSIQVPADRQPIVLMADHQTTGGYPQIATVITADLSVMAQRGPGQTVRFAQVSVEQAQDLLARQQAFLRS
jgi:antagonist of KipI